MRLRQRVLQVAAVLFGAASVYHLAAIAWHAIDPTSSLARHAVFVLIDGALAWALWWRPRGLFWVFAALGIQQLHSHGRALLRAWALEQRIDWTSVLVVVALPLVCYLLYDKSAPSKTNSAD